MSGGGGRGRAGRAIFQWALVGATVAVIAWLLYSRREELGQLRRLDLWTLTLASATTILGYYLGGWSLKLQAQRFGAKMTVVDAMLVGLATYTLNYLPMKSGTVLQGAVMKARYGVRLSEFAALITGNHLMSLWGTATMGGLFMSAMGLGGWWAWLLLCLPTATLAVLYVWGRARGERAVDADAHGESRARRAAAVAVEGMWALFRDLPLLAWLSGINIVLVLLQAVRLWLLTEALGVSIGPGASVVVASIALVTYRFSFLPGGLGFREGGMAAGSAAVGLAPAIGLALAVVDRAIDAVWILLLGLPASLYLSRLPATADADTGERYEGEPLP